MRILSEGDLHSKQPVGEFNLLVTDLLWVCERTLYEASRLSWMPVQAPMSPSASRIWRAIYAPNSWIRSTVIPGYPLGNVMNEVRNKVCFMTLSRIAWTQVRIHKTYKFTLFHLILNSLCTWKNKKIRRHISWCVFALWYVDPWLKRILDPPSSRPKGTDATPIPCSHRGPSQAGHPVRQMLHVQVSLSFKPKGHPLPGKTLSLERRAAWK